MAADHPRFADRRQAGRALAAALAERAAAGGQAGAGGRDGVGGRDGERGTVVLGLPRGGVVVAAEVAAALDAPLDVLVVRKIGLPWQPELAMGAIAAVGDAVETVRSESVIARGGVEPQTFDEVRDAELAELRRREAAYRGDRLPVPVTDRPVIVVDDGLATGATMRAAIAALRSRQPSTITVAVPVGSPATCADLERLVDEVVCLQAPRSFRAVGQGYVDFAPTSDDEVREALARAQAATP